LVCGDDAIKFHSNAGDTDIPIRSLILILFAIAASKAGVAAINYSLELCRALSQMSSLLSDRIGFCKLQQDAERERQSNAKRYGLKVLIMQMNVSISHHFNIFGVNLLYQT
jgi:hypothetical protein